jgi:hypothetical protein
MRKLLTLWMALAAVIALSTPAFSQMALLGVGKPRAAAGCADSNVIVWKTAVVTAGGTVSPGQETDVCWRLGYRNWAPAGPRRAAVPREMRMSRAAPAVSTFALTSSGIG